MSKYDDLSRRWSERAEIARKQGQDDVIAAAELLALMCEKLNATPEAEEPEVLRKANLLRKKIEASERHRTMCVEHGLSDAAIDATYEIQALEKELVEVVKS
jgi:hypothetical protein